MAATETEPNGKAKETDAVAENVEVYGEISVTSDDDNGYGLSSV